MEESTPDDNADKAQLDHLSTSSLRNEDTSTLSRSMNRLSINVNNVPHSHPSPQQPSKSSPLRSKPQPNSPSTLKAQKSPNNSQSSPAGSPKLSRRTSSGLLRNAGANSSPNRPDFSRSISGNGPRSISTSSTGGDAAAAASLHAASFTAGNVASRYLERDLARHFTPATQKNRPNTIVIVHDACYGHRYSRPRTGKNTLSLIVERPERIQAGVLGLSAAYVRLGERHVGGYANPRPDAHPDSSIPFRIKKTKRTVSLVSPAVTNIHGHKWMNELKQMCEAAELKLATGGKELSRPDDPGGSNAKAKLHEGDLYLCRESLNAFEGALGGVFDAVDTVFEDAGDQADVKRAFVCIRPPGHHCSSDFPSGFCWLNNVHIGIEHAVQTHGLTHAAIIDFDLHHGDGSQAITWERNARPHVKGTKASPPPKRAPIGYFSIHDINSYPCEYGDVEKVQSASLCIENAHGQSIWNVHLQPWKTEDEFWQLYKTRYTVLLDKARVFLRTHTERLQGLSGHIRPKSAIFLSAGFDASEWESHGMQRHKVNVPTSFYARLTADVVKLALEEGLSADGRVISVLEGGYSDRAIASGVLSHVVGMVDTSPNQDSSLLDENTTQPASDRSAWWSEAALAELEALVRPAKPPEPPRKPRYAEPPTYTSPTQASTAKAIDPSKMYRTVSGTVQPTPVQPLKPPPDVDWATSAHELSKLLIPTDRQINSCTHEQLSEPRVKKEKQSNPSVQSGELESERRQTRGRKAKLPGHVEVESENEQALPLRTSSQAHRRQTMPEVSMLVDEAEPMPDRTAIPPPARPRRRSSMASTTTSTMSEQASRDQSIHATASAHVGDERGLNVRKTRRASGVGTVVNSKFESTNPTAGPPVSRSNADAADGGSQTEDTVDHVTTGFKKLVLKMPARQEQSAEAAPKPTRKPPVARTAKAAPTKKSAGKATRKTPSQTPVKGEKQTPPVQSDTTNVGGASQEEKAPAQTATFAMRDSTSQPQRNVENQPTQAISEKAMNSTEPEAPAAASTFIPYEPPLNSYNSETGQPTTGPNSGDALVWLPPNSATPVALRRTNAGGFGKENLPVFTPDGHIPFAPDAFKVAQKPLQYPNDQEQNESNSSAPHGSETSGELPQMRGAEKAEEQFTAPTSTLPATEDDIDAEGELDLEYIPNAMQASSRIPESAQQPSQSQAAAQAQRVTKGSVDVWEVPASPTPAAKLSEK